MAKKAKTSGIILDVGTGTVRLLESCCNLFCSKKIIIMDPMDQKEQKEATAKALKDVFTRVDKRKRVAAILPNTAVFSRVRHFPPIPASRLRLLVEHELKQQIPFPLDQIIYDFAVINHDNNGWDVLMSAIKKDVAVQEVKTINDIGYKVNFLGVSSIATYNWLNCQKLLKPGLAVVDIGCQHTEVLCLGKRYGQSPHFFPYYRSINLGGADITSALSMKWAMTYFEAEEKKIANWYRPHASPLTNEVLDRLSAEIARTTAYFNSLEDGKRINQIYLIGGGSLTTGIREFLIKRLKIENINWVDKNVLWSPVRGLKQQRLYPKDSIDINLAP